MKEIPDFNQSELWVIQNTLRERYGEDREILLADSEVRLRPDDRQLTSCPTVYWEAGEAHFVIIKIDLDRYYCQFFYRGHEQFGTGVREFDNVGDCVTTLLQIQADHEADRREEASGE